jgi:hypothetical protein
MKFKTKLFTRLFFILSITFVSELLYLSKLFPSGEKKRSNLTSIPNLAISSDNLYLRAKSYANVGDILLNDGELPNSSKLGFVY